MLCQFGKVRQTFCVLLCVYRMRCVPQNEMSVCNFLCFFCSLAIIQTDRFQWSRNGFFFCAQSA